LNFSALPKNAYQRDHSIYRPVPPQALCLIHFCKSKVDR